MLPLIVKAALIFLKPLALLVPLVFVRFLVQVGPILPLPTLTPQKEK